MVNLRGKSSPDTSPQALSKLYTWEWSTVGPILLIIGSCMCTEPSNAVSPSFTPLLTICSHLVQSLVISIILFSSIVPASVRNQKNPSVKKFTHTACVATAGSIPLDKLLCSTMKTGHNYNLSFFLIPYCNYLSKKYQEQGTRSCPKDLWQLQHCITLHIRSNLLCKQCRN